MKVLHIGIAGVALASLVGCGSTNMTKRIDYRAGAVEVPSLELPPGLDAPVVDDRYKVPGAEGEGVATYSGYTKSGETAQARPAAGVLPTVKGVHLERNGAQRWLVVNDTPENVWAVVRAFWQENGLSLTSEDQAAGVMETGWAENRANIPQDPVRSVVGKVFDGLYASGTRDQYRTRLERGKDSIEIYISHRGMEEVMSADGNTSKWQARAADPELEAVMLQKLMVRFGGVAQPAHASTEAAAAAPETDAVGGDGKVSLSEVFDGGKVVVVNDAFDKAWRRVGLALERAGLAVEDKDRARGVYFLRAFAPERSLVDKLQFWKDNEPTDRRYRVNVKDGGASCEVAITDQDGAYDDTAAATLDKLYQNFDR